MLYIEEGQAYPGWMVLAVGCSSFEADPSTGVYTGPGRTEGPGEERQPLGGAALEPRGRGKGQSSWVGVGMER